MPVFDECDDCRLRWLAGDSTKLTSVLSLCCLDLSSSDVMLSPDCDVLNCDMPTYPRGVLPIAAMGDAGISRAVVELTATGVECSGTSSSCACDERREGVGSVGLVVGGLM